MSAFDEGKSNDKYTLTCIECGKGYGQEEHVYNCRCGGKLDVSIDLDDIEIDLDELIEREAKKESVIQKYFEFLPLTDRNDIVHLGEGDTRLLESKRLSEELGLEELYLKDETTNPTGSFKDRPILVGLNKALEFGAEAVATASSGNAATSLAAGAAKANIDCIALVPEDIPESKAAQLQFYGAIVFRVKGKKDSKKDPTVECLKELTEKEPSIAPVPSFGPINPYQIEGVKSIAYEIAEEREIEHVFVPVGGGGLLLGNYKGFSEFKELDIIDDMPKLYAVQSKGCAPFVEAYRKNEGISHWDEVDTVASGLADPYTWDGKQGMEALDETGGNALKVENEDILEAQQMLARYEGIFAEPSGVASLAGMMKAAEEGLIPQDESVCCEITGSGFKDLEIIQDQSEYPPKIGSTDELIEALD